MFLHFCSRAIIIYEVRGERVCVEARVGEEFGGTG